MSILRTSPVVPSFPLALHSASGMAPQVSVAMFGNAPVPGSQGPSRAPLLAHGGGHSSIPPASSGESHSPSSGGKGGSDDGDLLTGQTRIGSGVKLCQSIVALTDADALPRLRAFDMEHPPYLLLYPSNIIPGRSSRASFSREFWISDFGVNDVRNAAVLLEMLEAADPATPSYMGDGIAAALKCFGVIPDIPDLQEALRAIGPARNVADGLSVFQRTVQVEARAGGVLHVTVPAELGA